MKNAACTWHILMLITAFAVLIGVRHPILIGLLCGSAMGYASFFIKDTLE